MGWHLEIERIVAKLGGVIGEISTFANKLKTTKISTE
jgi:hypothetical protein